MIKQQQQQEDRLLSQEKFSIIKDIQEKIMNETGFSPNFKTLINEAINDEFAKRTINKYTEILKTINY